MEGPGGYQFTGRTVPVWNRWRKTDDFCQPWLLRFFDQLRFYEVSAEELMKLRESVPLGRHRLKIEATSFKFADYEKFLAKNAVEIEEFRSMQRQSFQEERERWEAAGLNMEEAVESVEEAVEDVIVPEGCRILESPVTGNVWKIETSVGSSVDCGASLMILEAMKMEIPVETDEKLEVVEILVAEGDSVRAGQALVVVKDC
jgi:urea carboxylase